jgi:hypothetical protein
MDLFASELGFAAGCCQCSSEALGFKYVGNFLSNLARILSQGRKCMEYSLSQYSLDF